MAFSLPQELIDMIIDFVAGDIWAQWFTLQTCALVCRSWVSRSRSHFFERCPRLESDNARGFRDLLQSPYCTFLSHVRTIRLNSWEPQDRNFDEILVAADLRRLENLCALELHVYVSEDAEALDSFRADFLTAFPAVTRLQLSAYIRNNQSLPLTGLISCFPALRELHVCDMPGAGPYWSLSSAPPPRGLRSLKLAGQSSGPILAWLQATSHLPAVDSVSLYKLRNSHIPIVRAALQQIGRALRHLDVSLDLEFQISAAPSTVDSTLTLLDWSLHPDLRTLAIHDSSWGSTGDFGPAQALSLIRTLATPKLECLELELNQALYQPPDWAALDALLCSAERFPCLRTVVFARNFLREHEVLRGALPMLAASELLRRG
ncbi:F-box domain-containing protein [Mycena sanguinolenta]|uniref:F-box domain-containing protein n=1 Tax=Mycena sanguinolenta TaxID=230812 RepID=A0A8H6ZES6_9AGAR|nr:F-box domain-containing protein [Mycena sanguinolenta]